MIKKIIYPLIGELEWSINGAGNYYIQKELVLYGDKIKVNIEFNIEKEDDKISQRQIDNYQILMNNHNELFDKILTIAKNYYNYVAPEYIDEHEYFVFEKDEIPERVETIEELLPLLILNPLQIYLETEYYDMAVGMGCIWDMDGLAIKVVDYDKDDFFVGTWNII